VKKKEENNNNNIIIIMIFFHNVELSPNKKEMNKYFILRIIILEIKRQQNINYYFYYYIIHRNRQEMMKRELMIKKIRGRKTSNFINEVINSDVSTEIKFKHFIFILFCKTLFFPVVIEKSFDLLEFQTIFLLMILNFVFFF
jgi:hypothetical protein